MQRVLAMALGLLAITLFLRWGEAVGWRDGEALYPERGLDVVVSSRGTLLPARLASRAAPLYETIVAGERILVEDAEAPPGIRAAVFGPDLEIADSRSFSLRGSAEAAAEFKDWLSGLPVPSICILGTSGDLRPPTEAAAEMLDAAFERMKATARPHRVAPASWAYLGLKWKGGFARLAESYSEDSGVILLYTIGPELRSYVEQEGEFTVYRMRGKQEVPLERDVSRGVRTGGVSLHTETLAGTPRTGMAFDPEDGEGALASIAWERVYVGQEAYLVSYLGFPDRPGVPSRSARCEVWIDGEKLAEREVADSGGWRPWPIDLGAYAGQRVRLELRASSEMKGSSRTPVVVWGEPRLHWSGE